jgi:hypothetical protein
MSFNVLAIRTADDEDGRLYPVVGAERAPVELEEWDGTALQTVLVRGLSLSETVNNGSRKRLLLLRDIKLDVLITDARVVLACKNWDQLPKAWGVGLGATSALITNVTRSVKAARARRGKMLLGHVRYPWLMYVGFEPKRRWLDSPKLRFGLMERPSRDQQRLVLIDLALAKSHDSAAIARSVAQRAAQYWLTHAAVQDPAARHRLDELAAGVDLPAPAAGKMALYKMPQSLPASADTAFPPFHVPGPSVAPVSRSLPVGPTDSQTGAGRE